jgi:oligopeptide/dipeptide ABC transporter ATP-binding protein
LGGWDVLLDVRNLRVEYHTLGGSVQAVDNVSFAVAEAESLGLVGESGCGKSTLGYGLMLLLPPNGRIVGGEVLLETVDLLSLPDSALRATRWRKVAMIFQNSVSSLNPVARIGDQIADALQWNSDLTRTEALERAAADFERVGLASSRLMQYPHEFSDGMKQRAMIALALTCRPLLVIADEPTTALDVVAQRQVLELLSVLREDLHLALILISHDVSVVAETCRRMAVMYAGKIVELGPTDVLLHESRHPYTKALIDSVPSLYGRRGSMEAIPGAPPSLLDPPEGCRFAPRCAYARPVCQTLDPPTISLAPNHVAHCHFAAELDFGVES